jgi:hypothetical protein
MFQRTIMTIAVVVLAGVGLYAAAMVDNFEYKFDTKDSIDGWVANDAKVEWKEGGADKSAGCIKISGGHPSADSPQVSFKCDSSVISFDYYVHGADTMRLRLSVAGADNQKKYGRYGNLAIRKVEPDKWLHAEAKLMDLPGMAEDNKAKAFPELEYNRIGFSTLASGEEGGYILIDNVKLTTPAAPASSQSSAPASAPTAVSK